MNNNNKAVKAVKATNTALSNMKKPKDKYAADRSKMAVKSPYLNKALSK